MKKASQTKKLSLSNFKLPHIFIPEGVQAVWLKGIVSADISRNFFVTMPSDFFRLLIDLTELNLSYNKLKEIPEALSMLTSLEVICNCNSS